MKRYSLLSMEGVQKTKGLMDVPLGRAKADTAVVNGTLLNVYTGEWIENQVVLIKGGWIVYVGAPLPAAVGPETVIIDAARKPVIPGYIDGHTHLADVLCCPSEFLRKAMPGGTTTIVTESIEPFPVCGEEGIVDFLDAFRDQPIKVFATLPPLASTSRLSHGMPLETLQSLLTREDVLGLGEPYWQAVIQDPDTFLPLFEETLLSGRKVEGHSAGARGGSLAAYVLSGISSCHEPTSREEVLERLRMGLHAMVREGSIRSDLSALRGLGDSKIDYSRLMLVTDGMRPLDLLEKGYMEYVVQKAVDEGLDPVRAVRMATLNAADYFGLDAIVGGIAPGRQADLLLLPTPGRFFPDLVISRGKIIARGGELLVTPREHGFSPRSLNSVVLPRPVTASDFAIPAPGRRGEVRVRVIDQVTELVTREANLTVPVLEGKIRCDPANDLLKVAAVERRLSSGKIFVGLIRGMGLKKGAICVSSAWDTADLIVVGENETDMAEAVNRVHALKGGLVLCAGGRVVAEVPLPVFGLLSELPMEVIAARIKEFTDRAKALGFSFGDPYRTMSPLSGVAIPFIRLCEEGLVDIKSGKRLPLFVD